MPQSIATLRLTRLNLGVNDIEVSERFYRDDLGLPTQRRGDCIEVRWADFLLILTARPPVGRGKFYFGFRVDSAAEVDAWATRLRTSGVDIVSGPETHSGVRQIYFLDPDSYEIEIYSDAS